MGLKPLFDHMRWADERALVALRAADPAPEQALEIFGHVLGAEHVWLSRLRLVEPSYPVWPELDLDECDKLATENADGFAAYLTALPDADVDRVIHYRNSAGKEFESTVEDILTHVAMHGSYHRGQVALLLRSAGAVPNPTDYIAFVRGAAAATRSDRP